ncbi:hypothetical protein [Massilia phosphatilytica]
MSLTPDELRQLAVTFPRAHAAQINAKAAKYGLSSEDVRQELSLICMEKGAEFDPSKGLLPQFLFGHLEKRLRRQLGAHTFAISLDRVDALDESTRALIENLTILADNDSELACLSTPDQPGVAKILSVARFASGKSSSDLARLLGVTPRRIRQILQELREEQATSNQFELSLEEGR